MSADNWATWAEFHHRLKALSRELTCVSVRGSKPEMLQALKATRILIETKIEPYQTLLARIKDLESTLRHGGD